MVDRRATDGTEEQAGDAGQSERPGPSKGPLHRLPGHDNAVQGSVFVGQLLIEVDGQLTQRPGRPLASGGQQGQVVSIDVHLL